jgi:hypothetical protein
MIDLWLKATTSMNSVQIISGGEGTILPSPVSKGVEF